MQSGRQRAPAAPAPPSVNAYAYAHICIHMRIRPLRAAPVPGGPQSSAPRGGSMPSRMNLRGALPDKQQLTDHPQASSLRVAL